MPLLTSCHTSLTPLRTPPAALPDHNLLLSSIETFDASGIDPVVVSSKYWSGLQSNIIKVLVFQAALAVGAVVLAAVLATRGSSVTTSSSADSSNWDIKDTKGPTPIPNFTKLLLCIIVDAIGTSSELIPIYGELTDVIWAPLAAYALRSLYGGSNVVFALELAEELLPLTDVLPLATVCWVVETFYGESKVAKILGVGFYSKDGTGGGVGGNVVDVDAREVMEDEEVRDRQWR